MNLWLSNSQKRIKNYREHLINSSEELKTFFRDLLRSEQSWYKSLLEQQKIQQGKYTETQLWKNFIKNETTN